MDDYLTPRVALLVVGVGLAACSSPSIKGAQSARASAEPAGRVTAQYAARGCVDAGGAPADVTLTLALVEFPTEHWALIVRRPGYDSLVIDNAFSQNGEWVFQAQSRPASGKPVLFDVRLRAPDWERGRLAYARQFRERRLPADQFQAYFDAPVLRCSLEKTSASK
jgi:hypothetical protein